MKITLTLISFLRPVFITDRNTCIGYGRWQSKEISLFLLVLLSLHSFFVLTEQWNHLEGDICGKTLLPLKT